MTTNEGKLPHTIPAGFYLVVGVLEVIAATIAALYVLVAPGQVGVTEKLILIALIWVKGIAMLMIGAVHSWQVQQ